MTEKRFRIEKGYIEHIVDYSTAPCPHLLESMTVICRIMNELDDENEQLKSRIKEVIELLSEEVDLFSDKATEHDINAYIELKELDNKDAYYMAIATKKAIKMLRVLQE